MEMKNIIWMENQDKSMKFCALYKLESIVSTSKSFPVKTKCGFWNGSFIRGKELDSINLTSTDECTSPKVLKFHSLDL